MAPITHALISWWAANVPALARRDRLAIFLAGIIPDLDGLGLLFSRGAYESYHHVVCHNLVGCLVVLAPALVWLRQGVLGGVLIVLSWHLHLACDYFGSGGPGGDVWVLPYLWPFVGRVEGDQFVGPAWYWNPWQWALDGWPNLLVTALAAAGWFYVAIRLDRTWFEFLSGRLDRYLCRSIRSVFGGEAVAEWSEREGRLIRRSFALLATLALLACAVAGARASPK
jgi:hypothetical protein